MEKIKKFIKDEDGLETVEWAVMLFLIVSGLVLIVTQLGEKIGEIFQGILDELS